MFNRLWGSDAIYTSSIAMYYQHAHNLFALPTIRRHQPSIIISHLHVMARPQPCAAKGNPRGPWMVGGNQLVLDVDVSLAVLIQQPPGSSDAVLELRIP